MASSRMDDGGPATAKRGDEEGDHGVDCVVIGEEAEFLLGPLLARAAAAAQQPPPHVWRANGACDPRPGSCADPGGGGAAARPPPPAPLGLRVWGGYDAWSHRGPTGGSRSWVRVVVTVIQSVGDVLAPATKRQLAHLYSTEGEEGQETAEGAEAEGGGGGTRGGHPRGWGRGRGRDWGQCGATVFDCVQGPPCRDEAAGPGKGSHLGRTLGYKMYTRKLIRWDETRDAESLAGLISEILETSRYNGGVTASHGHSGHSPLPLSFAPGETIDIAEMAPSTVRYMLELFQEPSSESEVQEVGAEGKHIPVVNFKGLALQRWIQMRNWPAVQEMILTNALKRKDVDLSDLHMDSVPDELRGLCLSYSYPFSGGGEIILYKPGYDIAEMLEKNVSKEETPVSHNWMLLCKALPEKTLKWTEFLRLAKKKGVGTSNKEHIDEIDLSLCCEFLSDAGAIIHFRHSQFQSNSRLKDMVVCQPLWFNDLMAAAKEYASGDSFLSLLSQMSQYANIMLSRQGDSLRELMLELDLMFMTNNSPRPYLSFSFLPAPSPSIFHCRLNKIWEDRCQCPDDQRDIVNGRSIDFRCPLIEGLVSKVMTMLCHLPDVTVNLYWKTGMWLSKTFSTKESPISQRLLITYPGYKNNSFDVIMLTTFLKGEEPHWKCNLMAIVISWMENFVRERHLSQAVYSYPCPICLSELVQTPFMLLPDGAEGQVLPPQFHFFSVDQAQLTGGFTTCNFICKQGNRANSGTPVHFTDLVPERDFLTVTPGGPTSAAVVGTKRRQINGYAAATEDGSPRITLPMANCLRAIPTHPNVVKVLGSCILQTTNRLSLVTEAVTLTIPPCFKGIFEDILGLIPQAIELSNFLEMCVTHVATQTSDRIQQLTTLEKIFPMSLRAKILRNVASGLQHLHNQNPPLVIHGEMPADPGRILVTSLDESDSGPWAKVVPAANVVDRFTHCSTKDDVRNFGILVYRVMEPLADFVEIQLANSIHTSTATTNTKTTATTTSTTARPNHAARRYDDSSVGFVNTGPTIALLPIPHDDVHILVGTAHPLMQLQPTVTTTATPSFSEPTTSMPDWARQVITCCWSPVTPSMSRILNVWDHCEP
ncbi:hypothetical protein Pelo_7369 [Pelomyxa schiedti]|nr:hypothetical protein Pelo_7369 [Pelomyxa schiedti]